MWETYFPSAQIVGIESNPDKANIYVNGKLQFDGGDIFSALNDGEHATITINYTAEDSGGAVCDATVPDARATNSTQPSALGTPTAGL